MGFLGGIFPLSKVTCEIHSSPRFFLLGGFFFTHPSLRLFVPAFFSLSDPIFFLRRHALLAFILARLFFTL